MTNVPVEIKKIAHASHEIPALWHAFRGDMNRMIGRFADRLADPNFHPLLDIETPWTFSTSGHFSAPAIDIAEDDKAYTISAELPGIEEKDVNVSVANAMLVIKGEKRQEKQGNDRNYHVSERTFGSFQRTFAIPEGVNKDAIGAAFAKGVLTVTLPKSADAQKAKRIDVKAA